MGSEAIMPVSDFDLIADDEATIEYADKNGNVLNFHQLCIGDLQKLENEVRKVVLRTSEESGASDDEKMIIFDAFASGRYSPGTVPFLNILFKSSDVLLLFFQIVLRNPKITKDDLNRIFSADATGVAEVIKRLFFMMMEKTKKEPEAKPKPEAKMEAKMEKQTI